MLNRETPSVLVVSQTDKAFGFITNALPSDQFGPILSAHSAGEISRMMINQPVDIVIINTPLKDDFGTELAVNLTQQYNIGVLMLIKADVYEQVTFEVEDYGVLTLSRPCTVHDMYQALKLLAATQARLKVMEQKASSLEQKMAEIRLINRAKGILMERMNMTEPEAHRHLEKAAMDMGVKKTVVASNIIQSYENDT